MNNLSETRDLLTVAKPVKRLHGYKPPAIIAELAPRFLKQASRPEPELDGDGWNADVWQAEQHWEWNGRIRKDGFLYIASKGQNICAWRFAWLLENGPIPDGLYPRPVCGSELCVRPSHLRLRERQTRGVLDDKMRRDAHALFHQHDFTARRLAEIYKVSESTIYRALESIDGF